MWNLADRQGLEYARISPIPEVFFVETTQALAHRKILSAPVVISDSLEDMESESFDRMSAPVSPTLHSQHN